MVLADVQTRNVVAVIDPSTNRLVRRIPLPGCSHDHGLLVDATRRLAFVACDGNARLLTLDLRTMNVTGVATVGDSPDVLALGAAAQTAIFLLTGSVALLADLIHNFGDALTAVPLAIAFFLRSYRGEKIAGLLVVLAIFVSACVALYETILRFIHPQQLTHLWVLAAAGLIGFAANELAAGIRLRGGRLLSSPALIADGNHARADGFVSLGVIASAALVALGAPIGDPIVGLVITVVILKITWDSWRVVSTTDPGEMHDDH
jgi:DNA-binding beta-propeller fold protein YncE